MFIFVVCKDLRKDLCLDHEVVILSFTLLS